MQHNVIEAQNERDRSRAESARGISNDVILNKVLAILMSLPLRGRLLDYGAGAGNFTRLVSSIGIFSEIVAVDILLPPPKLPDNVTWVDCNLNFSLPLPPEHFDCIISTEVIEHLENPRAVVRECFRLLKPGGYLVMTTPNQECFRSYCALIFGGHYAGFLGASYPAHITALLRLDITRIFTESGFSQPDFYFTDSGGLPKFPGICWQQISFNALRGRLWSDNLIAVARKSCVR